MALVLAAGMGLFEGIDKAAYSSPAWTEFRRFFDARTELYDFAGGAPDYAGNEAFYDSEGITKEEVSLYQNYTMRMGQRPGLSPLPCGSICTRCLWERGMPPGPWSR